MTARMGVEKIRIVPMQMVVVVAMGMIVMMIVLRIGGPGVTPGAAEHPRGNENDNDPRHQQEPRFGPLIAEVCPPRQRRECQRPDDDHMGGRGGKAEKNGLRNGAAHGDDEGRHHGL